LVLLLSKLLLNIDRTVVDTRNFGHISKLLSSSKGFSICLLNIGLLLIVGSYLLLLVVQHFLLSIRLNSIWRLLRLQILV
jgi:hypothetical protein